MQICGEEDRFRGEKINIAELQISTELPSVDQAQLSGHGHSRKDRIKFYKTPKGNVCHTKLFEEVKMRIEKISNKGASAESAEKFLERHCNLVVIAGQPGIGKSTLTKRLVEKMWESSPLFNAEIVFFIQFRKTNYKKETDLLLFLAPFLETDFFREEEKMKILEKLQHCDNVFIVMDGLDEATIDPTMNQPNSFSVRAKNNAAGFIQNLMAGNILPRSKKIITSRPYRIAQLPEDFQPKFLFTIQGLDEDGIMQICSNICDEDSERRSKIIDYLDIHPDLKTYCYTPVLCIMVMESLDLEHAPSKKYLTTITAIFVSVFKKWLKEKERRKISLKNTCRFAFKKFKDGQFYFRDHELNEEKVEEKNISTFLNTLLKGNKEMYFVHLMWQEFLVAAHLMLYTKAQDFSAKSFNTDEEDEQQAIFSNLKHEKYGVVASFLFGLCNKSTLDNFLDCIDVEEGLNSTFDRETIKVKLKELVFEDLRRKKRLDSIFSTLQWVRETEDAEFCEKAASRLKNELNVAYKTKILPNDILNLNWILRFRNTAIYLVIENPTFVGKNCLQYFYKELQNTLNQNPNIQVRV